MSHNIKWLSKMFRVYFSHAEIWFYIVIAAALVYFSFQKVEAVGFVGLFLVGWALYLVQEYLNHVFIFHGPVPKNKFLYKALYRVHLGHHDKPKSIKLLFTPLWYTFPFLLLNGYLCYLVVGNLYQASAVTSGVVVGYLLFEWCHMSVHTSYKHGVIMNYVKVQHMGHHYWNERRWFVISPPALVFDLLCGTGGKVESMPKSDDPMTSGVSSDDDRLISARKRYPAGLGWDELESDIWRKGEDSVAR